MRFRDYMASKAIVLCVLGIGGLFFLLISYLCSIPMSLILLLLLCVVSVAAICLVTEWYRTHKRLQTLKNRLMNMEEKYLIGETLERPRDAIELEYYFLMKEISRSAIGMVELARAQKQDYCDYVESWIHEIKTPLTACNLILANHGEDWKLQNSKLRRELRRADNLTETILTYAKLRTVEQDMQIGITDLRSICDQAIREEMELLIAANISISVEGEATVYTDAKMMVFMLKQLLINCSKYCPGCRIMIRVDGNRLTFVDDGPGIPAHELPRVTQRGFTGAAWRKSSQSTGMGLYIVSELCKQLNISLEMESKEHAYTRFVFCFLAQI